MTGHVHQWANQSGEPLACWCGALWPGEPLPDPLPGRVPGYGELGQRPSWSSRVDRMVAGLAQVEG